METKIQMKSANFPKILAQLTHSNQFLKVFSVSAMGLCIVSLFAVVLLGTRDPVVLTLAPSAAVMSQVEKPKPEDEIKMAIRAYIEKRYKWEPTNVVGRLKEAEAFVASGSMNAYRSAAVNVARFSTEKLVSQRVYAADGLKVDLAKKTVSISGDRITSIQGMKAAGDLRLELSFDSGPRTDSNPWGVYITKEKEE